MCPQFSFAGSVDDADPSELPLCDRPASVLKQYFQEARSRFTDYTDKWSRSGQNNPDNFVNFLPRGGDTLYAMSKRVFILFRAAKMGTSDQDTFFIDLTSKAITTGGYEEGLTSSRSIVTEGEGGPVGSNSTGSRKRRRSGSDIVDSYDSSLKKVNKILGQLSGSLAPTPSSIATYEDPNVSKTLAITKMIDQVMEWDCSMPLATGFTKQKRGLRMICSSKSLRMSTTEFWSTMAQRCLFKRRDRERASV